jgi:hypothetical protein
VGDCEGGRKLLWYTRGGPAAPSPVAASPALAAQRRNQPILTECADGSVVYGGDCGKRR